MTTKSIELSDLIAEVAEECAAKAKQNQIELAPVKEEPKEVTETLDQLESNWRMAKRKSEEERHPTPKYQERSVPFNKKEEVLDYWRDSSVTEPYIDVIMEHVFGVPHEFIYDYEKEYTQIGKIPVRPRPIDRAYRRVELWGRVLATMEMKKIDDPTFREDVEQMRRNALSDVSSYLRNQEKKEMEEGENSVRKSVRKWGRK